MTEQEASHLVGCTAVNRRTGRKIIIRDIIHGCAWGSGGQLIPVDDDVPGTADRPALPSTFEQFWEVLEQTPCATVSTP